MPELAYGEKESRANAGCGWLPKRKASLSRTVYRMRVRDCLAVIHRGRGSEEGLDIYFQAGADRGFAAARSDEYDSGRKGVDYCAPYGTERDDRETSIKSALYRIKEGAGCGGPHWPLGSRANGIA